MKLTRISVTTKKAINQGHIPSYILINVPIIYIHFNIKNNLRTFERTLAISKVPTVSIFDAITGMPLYVFLEFRNVIVRTRST